ncbi:MAG: tail fiber domain-containing protein, partial [Bacteroidota bacterium]
GDILWATNGTDIYREEGSVGVGTATPTSKFQVADYGAEIRDVNIPNLSGCCGYGSGTNDYQTFIPNTTGRLTRVGFDIYTSMTSEVRIYEGAGSGGNLLGSFNVTGISGYGNNYAVPGNVILQAGQTYSIFFTNSGGLVFRNDNIYTNGFFSFNSANNDINLRIFIEPVSNTFSVVGDKVGIGTDSPVAPLHVANSTSLTSTNYGFLNQPGNTGNIPGSASFQVAIEADGVIRGTEMHALSDARIKSVKDRVDRKTALNQVLALQPTEYHYIDRLEKGDQLKTGFIAQEVAKIAPEAIGYTKGFVPNVYAMAEQVEVREGGRLYLKMRQAHRLATGDSLQILDDRGKSSHRIAELPSANEIILEGWQQPRPRQVFVYGKWVEDFHSIEYDHLYTLGIGAIQELHEQLAAARAQIETLQSQLEIKADENSDLKARQVQLETNQQQLFERLQRIEALMDQTAVESHTRDQTNGK